MNLIKFADISNGVPFFVLIVLLGYICWDIYEIKVRLNQTEFIVVVERN